MAPRIILSLAITTGCVPVDGDTYDIPAIIETAETRWRVHGLPRAKFGHREKFGNDPAKHRDFSAPQQMVGYESKDRSPHHADSRKRHRFTSKKEYA